MSANKYIILFSILLLLPLCVKAQRFKSVTERQAEQIGKRHYITTSNDTTLVVNFISTGLNSPETEFLRLDRSHSALDSLFHQKLDYTSEEAMLDMNALIQDLQREKKQLKGNNDGLSFRLASKNRDLRQKEIEAKKLVDAVRVKPKEDLSTEELAALYLKYGEKPTYYINGVEVDQSIVNQLRPSDVIKEDRRVKETLSGNPNGEIWITATEDGLNRIKLPKYQKTTPQNNDLGSYIQEIKRVQREKEIKELKSIPVIKRETTDSGEYVDIQITPQKDQDREGNAVYSGGTKVLKRVVTNPAEEAPNEVTIIEAAPSERNSIPVVRKREQSNEIKEETSTKKDETPKRSVRRIKEKEASQYKDSVEEI